MNWVLEVKVRGAFFRKLGCVFSGCFGMFNRLVEGFPRGGVLLESEGIFTTLIILGDTAVSRRSVCLDRPMFTDLFSTLLKVMLDFSFFDSVRCFQPESLLLSSGLLVKWQFPFLEGAFLRYPRGFLQPRDGTGLGHVVGCSQDRFMAKGPPWESGSRKAQGPA